MLRRELLRHALPATVRLIQANQADQALSGVIDDYLALQWLERGDQGLCLTDTGRAICQQAQRGRSATQQRRADRAQHSVAE